MKKRTLFSMLESLLFSKHLEKDEQVSKIVHQHWIVGIRELVWPVVSFLVSWLLLLQTHNKVAFYLIALWSIWSLVWLQRNFFDYYLDAWMITDKGIIDLAWLGWFHRESSRILYSDIQGISCEIQGIGATFLRYGTLTVEKISTGAKFSLPYVHKPRNVQTLILKNMETYVHAKNLKNAKHVQEILSEFVSRQVHLDSLKKDSPPDES